MMAISYIAGRFSTIAFSDSKIAIIKYVFCIKIVIYVIPTLNPSNSKGLKKEHF